MIRTIYCALIFTVFTIFYGIVGMILSLTYRPWVTKYAVKPWAKTNLWAGGIKIDVKGLENLPKEPCIIMFNHQSALDILAYMSILPIDWRAIMKKEVGKIPFIGWVSILSGHHLVARDGSRSDTKEVKKIVEKIRLGPSVVVAPEGTRSDDGKLLPFQKGGFLIAVLARVPVVTMVIAGGRKLLPKSSRKAYPGTMKIRILPPISVDELPKGREGREKLMHIVREQMEEVLAVEEATLPDVEEKI
ncbi:MAG: lysophospholipid acyltransferase family protein [Thermodesulfobacteriota bacterium]